MGLRLRKAALTPISRDFVHDWHGSLELAIRDIAGDVPPAALAPLQDKLRRELFSMIERHFKTSPLLLCGDCERVKIDAGAIGLKAPGRGAKRLTGRRGRRACE